MEEESPIFAPPDALDWLGNELCVRLGEDIILESDEGDTEIIL